MALARPELRQDAQASAVAKGPAATAVVLDASLSMRWSDGTSLFERGRDEAREHLGSPFEGFDGLITVWEEHARLTPSPEVLQTLAHLYVERRDSVADLFRGEHQLLMRPELMNAPMLVQRAPLSQIRQAARSGGFTSLRDAAVNLACDGSTTLEEINRVTPVE